MADTLLRVCSWCGREGTIGFRAGAGVTACSSLNSCFRRAHENHRLRTGAMGSIRYSGDTFDRVERLKKMGRTFPDMDVRFPNG